MSSILTTVAAPTSSIVANGNQAARADVASNQPLNNASAMASGQAAVANFSASSKGRGASFGDQKQVDASFDKQELKSKNEAKKEEGTTGQVLDVAA